jgi:hypothetical protein
MAQTLGSVIIDVQADTQKLVQGFDKAEKRVNKATKTMSNAIKTMAVSYLSFQGVNAFSSMIKGSIDAADKLGKLSEKLAISAQSLSELQYAAGFADVSISQLNAAMGAMIRRTGNFKKDGTGAAVKAMQELGISVDFARANFTDTETTFRLLIDRLGSVEDSMLRTKIAQDLFSKSAADVVRLANLGSKELDNYAEIGRKLGVVITDDMAAASAKLNDDLTVLNSKLDGFKITLANDLIPVLNELVTFLDENGKSIVETTKQLGIMVTSLIAVRTSITVTTKATALYSAAMVALNGSITSLNSKILLATISMKTFNKALNLSGIGLAAGAVITLANSFLEAKKSAESFKGSLDLMESKERLEDVNKQLEEINERSKNWTLEEKIRLGIPSAYDKLYKEKLALEKNIELIEKRNKKEKERPSVIGDPKEDLSEDENKKSQELLDIQQKILSVLDPQQAQVNAINEKYDLMVSRVKELKGVTADIFDIEKARSAELSNINIGNETMLDTVDEFYKRADTIEKALERIKSPIEKVNEEFMSMHEIIKDVFDKEQLKKFYVAWGKEAEKAGKSATKPIEDQNYNLKKQIGLWSDVTNSIMSMSQEGSTAAKIAQVAQTGLAIANGVSAILNQGNGDPYTAFARIAAMTALVSSTLSSFGVSGGSGGGGVSTPTLYNGRTIEQEKEYVEISFDPMIDRLDKQIEILEAIELNGSAQALQLKSAGVQFQRDIQLSQLDILDESFMKGSTPFEVANTRFQREQTFFGVDRLIEDITEVEKALDFSIINVIESNGKYGKTVTLAIDELADGFNLIEATIALGQAGIYNVIGAGELREDKNTIEEFQNAYNQAITEIQNTISDYALGIIEISRQIKDAGNDLKEYYDSITGTSRFQSEDINKAFSDVERISKGKTLSSYIETQISAIEKLSTKFGKETIDLLLSSDIEDAIDQINEIDGLSTAINEAFEGGVQEVLDYKDSIKLVSEIMATSKNNIKSFKDSLLTSDEKIQQLADKFGVDVPESIEDVMSIFEALKGGIDGLTDDELDALNQFKKAVEDVADARQNEIDVIQSQRNSLELTYLNLIGDTAEIRRRELLTIHESNRALQEKIWAYQDQQEAERQAEEARAEADRLAKEHEQLLIDVREENIKIAEELAEKERELAQERLDALDGEYALWQMKQELLNDILAESTQAIDDFASAFNGIIESISDFINDRRLNSLEESLSLDTIESYLNATVALFKGSTTAEEAQGYGQYITKYAGSALDVAKQKSSNRADYMFYEQSMLNALDDLEPVDEVLSEATQQTNYLKNIETAIGLLSGYYENGLWVTGKDDELITGKLVENGLLVKGDNGDKLALDETLKNALGEATLEPYDFLDDLDNARLLKFAGLIDESSPERVQEIADIFGRLVFGAETGKLGEVFTALGDAGLITSNVIEDIGTNLDLLGSSFLSQLPSIFDKLDDTVTEDKFIQKDVTSYVLDKIGATALDINSKNGKVYYEFDEENAHKIAEFLYGDRFPALVDKVTEQILENKLGGNIQGPSSEEFANGKLQFTSKDYFGTRFFETIKETTTNPLLGDLQDEITLLQEYIITYNNNNNKVQDDIEENTNDTVDLIGYTNGYLDDIYDSSDDINGYLDDANSYLDDANSYLDDIYDSSDDVVKELSQMEDYFNNLGYNFNSILNDPYLTSTEKLENIKSSLGANGSLYNKLQEILEALLEEKIVTGGNLTPPTIGGDDYIPSFNTPQIGYNPPPPTVVVDTWTPPIVGGGFGGFLDEPKAVFAFADGGIVTKPTLGLIGEAGYSEAVIPLKNPNDPLSMNSVVKELKAIREISSNQEQRIAQLQKDNTKMRKILEREEIERLSA